VRDNVTLDGTSWKRMAVALGSAVVCAIVAGAALIPPFKRVELIGFDQLINWRGEPQRTTDVIFVDISATTEKALVEWPIPRGVLAKAIRKITEGKPEVIGLDVELTDDRKQALDQDQDLVAALSEAGNVVLPAFMTGTGVINEPLPKFRDVALEVAAVNLYLDPDSAIRRVPLVVRVKGFERIGFTAALATNFLGAALKAHGPSESLLGTRPIRLDVEPIEGFPTGIPRLLIGDWKLPEKIDMLDVLKTGFDARRFAGKVVIIGSSSYTRKDVFETPLYARKGLVSGPEIHAAALATLIDGRSVATLAWSRLWVVNLLTSLVALAFVMYARPVRAALAVSALAIGTLALAFWLLTSHVIWMKFVSTESVLMLSALAGLVYRYWRGNKQERELKELFGRYVSPDVLEEVLRHPEGIPLEGQARTASILFTDIRGFTSTSAGQPPNDVIAWLNEYFEAMGEVIDENGGFLNKFIGDGLMVVFGAPVTHGEKQDAVRAVRTALQMLKRLEALNRRNVVLSAQGLWRPPVHIGLGIHTGPVAAGNVGSPRRMEYSVIGETVNLAARLESATRKFDADIAISPATELLVRDHFVTEPLGLADAKGFSDQVHIYTVRSEKDVSSGGLES
jgi:adenylate cyclase